MNFGPFVFVIFSWSLNICFGCFQGQNGYLIQSTMRSWSPPFLVSVCNRSLVLHYEAKVCWPALVFSRCLYLIRFWRFPVLTLLTIPTSCFKTFSYFLASGNSQINHYPYLDASFEFLIQQHAVLGSWQPWFICRFIQFVTTFPSLLEDSLSNSPFSEASLFPTVCAITFHASQRFARSPHSLQWPFQSIEELGYSRLVEYAYSCASKCDPIPLSRLSIVLMRFLVVCFVFFSILLNNVSQFQLS